PAHHIEAYGREEARTRSGRYSVPVLDGDARPTADEAVLLGGGPRRSRRRRRGLGLRARLARRRELIDRRAARHRGRLQARAKPPEPLPGPQLTEHPKRERVHGDRPRRLANAMPLHEPLQGLPAAVLREGRERVLVSLPRQLEPLLAGEGAVAAVRRQELPGAHPQCAADAAGASLAHAAVSTGRYDASASTHRTFTVPTGPFRCLAIITSPIPLSLESGS